MTGRFVLIDGSVFLIVTTQLHNVGLSRIAFDRELSSLVVFGCVLSEAEEIRSIKNTPLTSFQVFGDKDLHMEPNEILERQTLIALPPVSSIGYQLFLEVLSDSGYGWRATTIVDRSAFVHNAVGESTLR